MDMDMDTDTDTAKKSRRSLSDSLRGSRKVGMERIR